LNCLQATRYPSDRWKYYKLKRTMRAQLGVDDGDEELRMGEDMDATVDVSSLLSLRISRADVGVIGHSLMQLTSRVSQAEDVSFSLWKCLSLLLKGAASILPGPERRLVFAMQSTCYQLLGYTELAKRAAREAVRMMLQVTSSATTLTPPVALSTARCIALLASSGGTAEDMELVDRGMAYLHSVSTVWPGFISLTEALDESLSRQGDTAKAHTRQSNAPTMNSVITYSLQ
jgi:hypothetical protein